MENTTIDIALDLIDVPSDRARDLDPDWVEGLAAIIAQQGLLNPITLRAHGDRFRLVAGLHRHEAFRHLGRETIPARFVDVESDDEARLLEVMENLGRHELIALDRCHHLYELKQVWERMYPQAGHGGDRRSEMIKTQSLRLDTEQPEIFGFAKANAEKIGLSQRSIQVAVKIWTGLAPDVRHRLAGTDISRKQTELKALTELITPKRQREVIDLILGEEHPEIQNVAGAVAFLDRGTLVTPVERQFQAVNIAFQKLGDDAIDMIIANSADRVIASLQRLGRI